FLIPTMILVVFGMGISALLCGVMAKSALEDSANAQLRQALDLTKSRISIYLKDRKDEVQAWGQAKLCVDALRAANAESPERAAASEYLVRCQKQSDYFENIGLADTQGNVIAAYVASAVGKVNVKDREYFKESSKGKLFVSEVVVSRTTGNAGFMISTPVKDGGDIIGVLYGTIKMNAFNETFIDPVKVGKDGQTFIFQRNGTFIAHPDKSLLLKVNVKDRGFGERMMTRKEGTIHYSDQEREWEATFATNGELNWTLCIAASTDEIFAPVKRLYTAVAACVTVITLIAALIIALISHSTVRPIKAISISLREGADQVTSTSHQLSTSSRQVAEGTAEQAASIEETSSALETMASMTKQNAEHAARASRLMGETSHVVSEANLSMEQLAASMHEISKASEETSKIIRTIDEIAFQTNLLALNAAVEAARAGDAGLGFAVVSEEVRNLAMRSAEAAKSTASLIEGTVSRVKEGSAVAERTRSEFQQVAGKITEMDGLVNGITTASSEQAQGIDQINRAMEEMDKVVQQNAANAEESASASENMNSQAEHMKEFVQELATILSGNHSGREANAAAENARGSEGAC
ncbi:MAG: methyl-accepting chemotaxis protein, partial [Desulfobacteraceae bacterium]|nr:methyl-accepting chemotaxis protein [Desulfobacteraceae bacterium]